MITLKTLLLLLAISITFGQNLFLNTPSMSFNLNATNGQLIKLSSDQQYLIIAYSNGTFSTINRMNGSLNTYTTGSSSPIIQIESFAPWIFGINSVGGMGIFNTATGQISTTSQFEGLGLKGVAIRQLPNSFLFCLNFGNSVLSFNFNGANFTQVQAYILPPSVTATSVIYSSNGDWLIGGGSNSQVGFYNATSGVAAGIFQTSSPVSRLSLLNNSNIIGLTNNYQMVWINPNTSPFTYANLTTISPTTAFTGCPSNLIVAGSASNSKMSVYLQNGNLLQTLNYTQNTVTSVSCSQNYLASLDISGNVAVTSYDNIDVTVVTKLVAWAIALIAVGSVLFVVGIVLLIWCCRRRKAALEVSLSMNTTGKEMKHQMY